MEVVIRKVGRPKGSRNKVPTLVEYKTNGPAGRTITLPIPSSTLVKAAEEGTNQITKRKLSEAMRDVLSLTPKEAKQLFDRGEAASMADMIAIAMAIQATRGGRDGVSAAELLADRTEGKATTVIQAAPQNFVQQLVEAFVALPKKPPPKALPTIDAEEVTYENNEDRPIGQGIRAKGSASPEGSSQDEVDKAEAASGQST